MDLATTKQQKRTPAVNHILNSDQFILDDVLHYVYSAEEIRLDGPKYQFPDKTVIHLFYEPSTRTSCSFQAAANTLGCKVITLYDKVSSSEKGESLEDTIRTLAIYGDAIVLRHPAKGSSRLAASVSSVPILNAGDGNGQHPTQALLDIYTIHTELGWHQIDIESVDRGYINITFVGDLKNSRTVHSLILILALFPKMNFECVSPPELALPDEIVDRVNVLQNRRCFSINNLNLEEALVFTDVLYMTRIQKERFRTQEEYDDVMRGIDKYSVNREKMRFAKQQMIVMHPLPRLTEISTDMDDDPRSVYFKQVENGLYMRMAILQKLFLGGVGH
jgi:carbamoyl-phosphate synthase/aspartate carbamoyltransferase